MQQEITLPQVKRQLANSRKQPTYSIELPGQPGVYESYTKLDEEGIWALRQIVDMSNEGILDGSESLLYNGNTALTLDFEGEWAVGISEERKLECMEFVNEALKANNDTNSFRGPDAFTNDPFTYSYHQFQDQRGIFGIETVSYELIPILSQTVRVTNYLAEV